MTAPLETETDARNLPEVRAVYSLGRDSGYRTGWKQAWDEACRAILTAPLLEAGVEPGGYEARWMEWQAGSEPQLCAAAANLMRRMFEAGREAGRAESSEEESGSE